MDKWKVVVITTGEEKEYKMLYKKIYIA